MKKLMFFLILVSLLLSMNLVLAQTCSDTDGGINLEVKGIISGSLGGVAYQTTDFCSITDKSRVSEAHCIDADTGEINAPSSTHPNNKFFDCPSGTECFDGACEEDSILNTCFLRGGACRDFPVGNEINGGVLNCRGGEVCYIETDTPINSCPAGEEIPHCSNEDGEEGIIFQCNLATGVTTKFTCTRGGICKDGGCDFGDDCTLLFGFIPDIPCMVNDFIEKFKLAFSVVIGLLFGFAGLILGLLFIPKGTKGKGLISTAIFVILGVIGGFLAFTYFWISLLIALGIFGIIILLTIVKVVL